MANNSDRFTLSKEISGMDIKSILGDGISLWMTYAEGINKASAEADGHISILESLALKTNSLRDEFTGEAQRKASAMVVDGLRGESAETINMLIENNNALIEIHKKNGAQDAIRQLTLSNSNMKIALEEAKKVEKKKQEFYEQILNRPTDTLSSNQIGSTIDIIQDERYKLQKAIEEEKKVLEELEKNRPSVDKQIADLEKISKKFKEGSEGRDTIDKSIAKLQQSKASAEAGSDSQIAEQSKEVIKLEKELAKLTARYKELQLAQSSPPNQKETKPSTAELIAHYKELIEVKKEDSNLIVAKQMTDQVAATEKAIESYTISARKGQATQEGYNDAISAAETYLDGSVGGLRRYEGAVDKVNEAFEKTQQADLQKWFKSFKNQVDPASVAQERFNKTLDNLNKLFPEGSAELKKYTELAKQELNKTLQPPEEQLSQFQESFESAMGRIDGVFADAWLNLDDGFDSITDGIKDSFKQMLAEMAHEAITRPILLQIQQGVSGYLSGSSNTSFLNSSVSGVSDWLSSTSISDNMGNWGWSSSVSDGIGSALGNATGGMTGSAQLSGNMAALKSGAWSGQGAAGVSNLGMGAAAVGGYLAGNLLFDGKGYSSQGGSFGATAGAKIGSAAGPMGTVIGAIAGALFGSIGGSMLGSDDPHLDFRTRATNDKSYSFDRESKGVFATSAFGDIGFEAKNTTRLKTAFGGWDKATEFLNTLALMDNAIAALAESDDELAAMVDTVQSFSLEAETPKEMLDQISDRYLAALSHTSSRLTEGLSAEVETLTRWDGWEREDGSMAGRFVDYEELVVSVENKLMEALLDLDSSEAMGMIASMISMERVGDAIGGAVTDDLYDTLESAIEEDLDITSVIDQLNGALTALPSIGEFSSNFDILADGALEASGNIVDLAGGLQNLSALHAQYYDVYFTEGEKFGDYTEQMAAAMGQMGFGLVDSHEAFRGLIDGLDLTTEAGQKQYAGLMAIAPGMDTYIAGLEKEQKARDEINSQIAQFELEGKDLELFNLDLWYEELKTEAEKNGGDLVAIEKLYGLRRGKIVEEHANSWSEMRSQLHAVNSMSAPQTDVEKARQALGVQTSEGAASQLRLLETFSPDMLSDWAEGLGLTDEQLRQNVSTLVDARHAAKEFDKGIQQQFTDLRLEDQQLDMTDRERAISNLDAEFTALYAEADELGANLSEVERLHEASLKQLNNNYDDLITNFDNGITNQLTAFDMTEREKAESDLNAEFAALTQEAVDLKANVDEVAKLHEASLKELNDNYDQVIEDFDLNISNRLSAFDMTDREKAESDLNAEFAALTQEAVDLKANVDEVAKLHEASLKELNDNYDQVIEDFDLNISNRLSAFDMTDREKAESDLNAEFAALTQEAVDLKANVDEVTKLHEVSLKELNDNYDQVIEDFDLNISNRLSAFDMTEREKAESDLNAEFAALYKEADDLEANVDAVATLHETSLKNLNDSYDQAITDFNTGIANQLTAFNLDGQALDLFNWQQEKDEAIKQAKDIGGDVTAVEELYGLKRTAIVENYAKQSAEALNTSVTTGLGDYLSGVSDYVSGKQQDIKQDYQEQFDLLKEQARVARELRDYVEQLRLSELSPYDPGEKLQEASEQFAALFVKAEAGDLDAAGKLQSAADAYLQNADAYYGRTDIYTGIFNDVSDSLDELGLGLQVASDDYVLEQLEKQQDEKLDQIREYAEDELSWAETQSEQLTGISDLLEEWPDRFKTLLETEEEKSAPEQPNRPGVNILIDDLDGSHAKGLSRVPRNGYRAKLHKNEMVLTADVSNHIRQSMKSGPVKQGSDPALLALLGEVKSQNQELQRLRAEVQQLRSERSQDSRTAERQRTEQQRSTDSLTRVSRTPVEV